MIEDGRFARAGLAGQYDETLPAIDTELQFCQGTIVSARRKIETGVRGDVKRILPQSKKMEQVFVHFSHPPSD
jgi:hypothetical protein